MKFSELPPLGAELEGGIFAGITTRADGTHSAVICLPENGTSLTWAKAKAWAKKQGGELPTRPVASLLFANVKATLPARWHWTSEEENASYAWCCTVGLGDFYTSHKSFEGSAVAVRYVKVTP